MGDTIIKDKYKIMDELFSDEFQKVYVARNILDITQQNYIINEFKSDEIINHIKDAFTPSNTILMRNFVETFYVDSNFYVVSKICPGNTLENFLSTNNLRVIDKMYLVEDLLNRFSELEKLDKLILFTLLDMSNISVVNKKSLCFNHVFYFSKDLLNVSYQDVQRRIGDIICCIFANTTEATFEKDKDCLPPALIKIIDKCYRGEYTSSAQLISDFKDTLLYSTFMGQQSIDAQIRRKIEKAKFRHKYGWLRKLAAVFIIGALIYGGRWYISHRPSATEVQGNEVKPPNNKPAARFTISNQKVYEGEEVTFVSQSTDPDIDDKITSYLWTVSLNGTGIFTSNEQTLTHKFEKPGSYTISLIVQDSNKALSDLAVYQLEVLPKKEIPASSNNSSNNERDRK